MIDLASALWNQRYALSEAKDRLVRFRELVNCPGNLPLGNWFQLYAVSLNFAHDLIIEVGRGYGNLLGKGSQRLKNLGYSKNQ